MNHRIVFFGTPEFAVASLEALLISNAHIVAVVTAPDKPSGRGMQSQYSDVKRYALEQKIPILQPTNMKSSDFIEQLKSLNPDIFVVVAFRMMPEAVWNLPPMGTINLHGALLPKYRGAAPINWAIINGEKETGVTTFKLKHEIDTGDILLQKSIPILDEDTAGTIYDKLMVIGADLLVETIIGLFNTTLVERPQKDIEVSYAPKLFKDNTIIDFDNSCVNIHNFVRGLSPYPCAYTYIGGKLLKVFKTHYDIDKTDNTGTFDTDGKKYLRVSCVDGWIYLDEVQLEGKKKMNVRDFLNGHGF